MQKLCSLVVGTLLLSSLGSILDAQCTGIRYRDFMFTDSVQSNIKYGQNYRYNGQVDSLLLDMHFPKSDPSPHNRPLVIIAHSGGFFDGDKTGTDVVPLATDFARMGYVASSFNYRLGIDGYPAGQLDSLSATRALMRGVQDAHAVVRYFRKSAAVQGNPYGIDTSQIFFVGLDAGGFMALDLAYLNQKSQFPAWCDTTKPGLSGGIEGASGNPGYPSNVKAIINICGAIGDTSWIKPGATPLLSFQGDSDKTVPYATAHLIAFDSVLQTVHGAYSIALRANHVGIINCFFEWKAQDHLPNVANQNYYDTCMNLSRNFLVHFTCGDSLFCDYRNPMAVVELSRKNVNLHCYPNPANNLLTVDLSELYGEEVSLNLYNNMGQAVRKYKGIRNAQFVISKGDLPEGLYLLDAVVKGKRYVSRIVFY